MNRVSISIVVTVLTASLCGCDSSDPPGDGGTSDSGSGSDGGSTSDAGGSASDAGAQGIPLEEWRDLVIRAECERPCSNYAPGSGRYGSVEQCISQVTTRNSYFVREIDENIAGIAAGRIVYDPVAAQTCIDSLSAGGCESRIRSRGDHVTGAAHFPGCVEALRGQVEEGETCFSHRDCIGGDVTAYCAADRDTCAQLPVDGAPCEYDPAEFWLPCAVGFYCNSEDSLCHAQVEDGESCLISTASTDIDVLRDCLSGHLCLDGVCGTPPVAVDLGEDCWVDGQCPESSSCEVVSREPVEWRCTAYLGEGEACDSIRSDNPKCAETLQCTLEDTPITTCERLPSQG